MDVMPLIEKVTLFFEKQIERDNDTLHLGHAVSKLTVFHENGLNGSQT